MRDEKQIGRRDARQKNEETRCETKKMGRPDVRQKKMGRQDAKQKKGETRHEMKKMERRDAR